MPDQSLIAALVPSAALAAAARRRTFAVALVGVLGMTTPMAGAQDATNPLAKYPDWHGQWVRSGAGHFDPTQPRDGESAAPFTVEYRAIVEAAKPNLAAGGAGLDPTTNCVPPGLPRDMLALEPVEFVVTPETTYVLLSYFSELRRVHTDGGSWPQTFPNSFTGYSIGKWEDTDHDGRYDVLEVETRGMRGPRVFEAGLPLHRNNQTVVKERIYLDPKDPDVMHNDITTIDDALTRPWTVARSYRRDRKPSWIEYICEEANHYVTVGRETYFLGLDGYLMPTRKDQPPPDLRYFEQSRQ